MRLLFVALTKHQYRYFKDLSRHLKADAHILFLPSLHLDFKALFRHKDIDTKKIKMLKFKELDVKYSNPLIRQLYKLFLTLQIPFVISAVKKALHIHDPDFVLFWNGKKFHQAIGVEVSKKYVKKCVFFENGLLPDTTQMDFQGVNAANSVPRDVTFYKKLPLEKSCSLPDTLQVRDRKRVQKELSSQNLPEHYIFVPFQVAYDTQIIHHSPWIEDMYAFFDLVCRVAQKSGLQFVIKEHPSDRVSDYSDLYRRVSENVQFSRENTQKLIENADAIITINSTVGIEGLLFTKRVIVLGEAFFAIDGIVKRANDEARLLAILQNLDTWRVDQLLIEKFLKYLKCIYLVPDSWRSPTQRHYVEIQKRLENEMNNA